MRDHVEFFLPVRRGCRAYLQRGSQCRRGVRGMFVGMPCVDGGLYPEQWLAAFFGEHQDAPYEGEHVLLLELYEDTRRLLTELDFSCELFLPDDASLSEHAQGLSEWCHGFLSGLGYEADGGECPDDCGEVRRDLRYIFQLDTNAAGEADAEACRATSEFVRVGGQLIRGELEQQQQALRLH